MDFYHANWHSFKAGVIKSCKQDSDKKEVKKKYQLGLMIDGLCMQFYVWMKNGEFKWSPLSHIMIISQRRLAVKSL